MDAADLLVELHLRPLRHPPTPAATNGGAKSDEHYHPKWGQIRGAHPHAFGVTLRGESELLSGRLDDAEVDLIEGGRLHRVIGGATGQALALQGLAELELRRGDRDRATGLLSDALELARLTDIGFHLLDRIYATRIELAEDPAFRRRLPTLWHVREVLPATGHGSGLAGAAAAAWRRCLVDFVVAAVRPLPFADTSR